jgi:hypothetical protein
MADTLVTCGDCGKSYLVPTPDAPVLAAGHLAPVEILRTPGLGGNSATGMAPVPLLPSPVSGRSAGAAGVGAAIPPPKRRRGVDGAVGAPFPWEMSPEVRASAAAIFGADANADVMGGEDELAAVQLRLRKERFRTIARWIMCGVGMALMIGLTAFFLRG